MMLNITELDRYRLRAVAGSVALVGFFVDMAGLRVGTLFAYSLDAATPRKWADVAGGTLPSGAVGVHLRATAAGQVYYIIETTPDEVIAAGTFDTNGVLLGQALTVGKVG